MSNSGNKTDDQISCERPIFEALSMVSLEEPSSTTGEPTEGESFPISTESEVADIINSASSVEKTSERASTHPITPNPDVLAPSYLKESFEIFKQRYPPSSFFVDHGPPAFRRGRAFSISEVELRDDWAEQKYRETFPGKFPVPSGIWEELAHLDAQLEFHYQSLESFLPNEEWVARQLAEHTDPWFILHRYLNQFYFVLFFVKMSIFRLNLYVLSS